MYDALRSERNAFADSSLTDNYRKGEDALVEALILSCCQLPGEAGTHRAASRTAHTSSSLPRSPSASRDYRRPPSPNSVYFSPSLHTHTIELQYEVGRPLQRNALRASVGGARDAARGAERCPPFLQPCVRERRRAPPACRSRRSFSGYDLLSTFRSASGWAPARPGRLRAGGCVGSPEGSVYIRYHCGSPT